ncbi:MAG: LLM class flavin-dependent oxidoreductase [Alphaproteobacteria bacterium]|nr:LLM class flavin-dependent oxidoreductase [Alphaproteobacteria bacterium]MCB9929097.1 LLM class flavin-dependent oxidoreductase [Alphaproteobacteria bacterium]
MTGLDPTDFPASPLSRALEQPFLLGLFLPIQDGGWTPSTLERTTTWSFDYNAALAQRAEALGFDLVFGLAQWTPKGGHGGQIKYREISIDSFMTVAALAAVTERILLISTIHVLYGPWHPLHLAKFGATLDHISGGRWGANIVTGHIPREARMFGQMRPDHGKRYEMADVFTTRLKELWAATENLTVDGPYWAMENAFCTPKPLYGRPVLVNATGSADGIGFAARHSDVVFITSPSGNQMADAVESLPPHTAAIRQAAAAEGRRLRTIINPMVVCRPTEKEALAYRDAIVAAADTGATEGFAAITRGGDAVAWSKQNRQYAALGGNLHVVGSPDQVVEHFLALQQAGCDGVQVTFYDFAPDLEYFGEAVLPLMREAGLRVG